MKGQHFPEDFQKSVVSKFLNRGSKTADSVSQDVGVSLSCIFGWTKKYANFQGMTKKPERKPNDRTTHEKILTSDDLLLFFRGGARKILGRKWFAFRSSRAIKKMPESRFDPKP